MKVKLTNVVLSFPALFKPKGFKGSDDNKKYSATYLLDKVKNKKDVIAIKKAMDTVAKEKWGAKVPKRLPTPFGEASEFEDEYEGYDESRYYLGSSSTKRRQVVNRDLSPITEDDDIIYPGCIVNASVSFWAQDNEYGRRINCELRTIQFVKDGENIGGEAPVDPEEEFEDLSDEDEDDDDASGLL